MPIWKDPTKDPPKEGETYSFIPNRGEEKIGLFILADSIHPKKQVHPDFLGWMKSTEDKYYEVWADERTEVTGYKYLVPHM